MMNDFVEKKVKWVFDTRRRLLKMPIPGQNRFKMMLDQANVFYVKEEPSFKIHTSNVCFMDFYIPYFQLHIEIDGRQHRYEDQFDKDISKAEFLWGSRIATLRLTNDEVDMMKKVDLEKLWGRVPETQRREIETIKKNEREGWRLFYSCHGISLEKPVWLYSKENKRTYRFENILELQRSVHYSEKKVFDVLKGEDKSNFFVSFDEEDMKE